LHQLIVLEWDELSRIFHVAMTMHEVRTFMLSKLFINNNRRLVLTKFILTMNHRCKILANIVACKIYKTLLLQLVG